ncbi:glutaredoxin domain-containing protein [Anaerolineales bacterium HSG6]|nr:glutaredoxin domain-containing protein [Anaerolineales bacterium HSG6]MDM8532482.1 glutaredoxin domain-containing protein [Anaerolineales bacterium HSG25]
MNQSREIVMYARSSYCPSVALARDLLKRYNIPYREIDMYSDEMMVDRVKTWTHGYSVPTIIIANAGEDVPYTDFLARPTERTIKGYDRGPMITEPTNRELENWLHKHGFLDKPYKR